MCFPLIFRNSQNIWLGQFKKKASRVFSFPLISCMSSILKEREYNLINTPNVAQAWLVKIKFKNMKRVQIHMCLCICTFIHYICPLSLSLSDLSVFLCVYIYTCIIYISCHVLMSLCGTMPLVIKYLKLYRLDDKLKKNLKNKQLHNAPYNILKGMLGMQNNIKA